MRASVWVFVALVSCAFAATKWDKLSEEYTFSQYLREWTKSYPDAAEYKKREQKFSETLAKILKHNQEDHPWKMGVNQFADWFPEEFEALRGFDKGMAWNRQRKVVPTPKRTDPLPAEVDWREKHILTAVKDQGRCGSCWTFASAAQVESHYALATRELPVLSEQQILDCANNSAMCGGTGGCEGGIAQLAYETLMRTGMAAEWTYPYQSYFGHDYDECRFDKSKMGVAATLDSYVDVPSNDNNDVMRALAEVGPLAVNVDASEWHLYETGVFTACNMTKNIDINHVVQLVGYGHDRASGLDFWTVRNSWSPKYGEDGFIRVFRYAETTCGMDNTPLDGTGCVGGPSSVRVCGSCGMVYDASYPVTSKRS